MQGTLSAPLLDNMHEVHERTNRSSVDSVSSVHSTNAKVHRGKDKNVAFRRTSNLQSSVSVDPEKHKVDLFAGRMYAVNAPKIFLETITARTSLLIIALTYLVFFIGFGIDINTTYKGVTSNNHQLTSLGCFNYGPKVFTGGETWSCSSGNQWNSSITHLSNVLSFKLSVKQTNLTHFFPADVNHTFTIKYNVKVWACYENDGCGNNFQNNDQYTDNPSIWQKVLFLSSETINIDLNSDVSQANEGTLNSQLISNTFQNQESIPTNGLVRSYFLYVDYVDDPYGLYSGLNSDALQYITYSFDIVTRPSQPISDSFTVVLMFFTLVLFVFYVYIIYKQSKVLSEQKWLIAYFILLIMFQNPVYIVIVWFNPPPHPGAAYASYFFNDFSQSGLFILWILFADSLHRKTRRKILFYGPKVFMGFMIFLMSIIILTFQFPSVSPGKPRDALVAVANWSTTLQVEFITFTFAYMIFIWIWMIVWFIRLFLTHRKLKRLPYMTTRYIQLSYRFFLLQATLVTIYYIFQYAFVLYWIGSSNPDPTSLTDSINTLFRQQSQLFGKTLFLTVYAMILTFLFLPSNLLDNSGFKTLLAATYVITEEEHQKITKFRKQIIHNMKKNVLNQMTGVNQLVNAKVDVFCVDLALRLRNVSFQAYYDVPAVKTVSGYEGAHIDLDSIGFDLIENIYDKSHEVVCYILREKAAPFRLVVTFRGTASKRQMEDNLNYKKTKINFNHLNLYAIDLYDGLNFRETPETDFELESVSDDEDEDLEFLDDLERGSEDGVFVKRSFSETGQTTTKSGKQSSLRDFRDAITNRADNVRENITGAFAATGNRIKGVVGATGGFVQNAASYTPGLKTLIGTYVHSGFWEAYTVVRSYVHEILRRELKKQPAPIFFTGHSLGGALATFAALDVSLNTIPRVNAYLKHQEKLKLARMRNSKGSFSNHAPGSFSNHAPFVRSLSASGGSAGSQAHNRDLFRASRHVHSEAEGVGRSTSIRRDSVASNNPVFVKRIKAVMYSFGAPRVGNFGFKQLYDRVVPSSFRVVVDGDIVAGLPPSGYDHIGTEILIDSLGAGSIIIDPSFVERWLRTHIKSSVAVHSLIYYRKGLLGLKLSAEYLKQYAKEIQSEHLDPLRLAIQLRNTHKIEKLVEAQENLADNLTTIGATHEDDVESHGNHSVSDNIQSEEISVDKDKIAMRDLKSFDEHSIHETQEHFIETSEHQQVITSIDEHPVTSNSRDPSISAASPSRSPAMSFSNASPRLSKTSSDSSYFMKSNLGQDPIINVIHESQQPQTSSDSTLRPSSAQKLADSEDISTPIKFPSSPQIPATKDTLDKVHYEHDVRNMNELMSQIKSMKKGTTMEEWLKNNTIKRFQRKKEVPQESKTSSGGVILGSQAKKIAEKESAEGDDNNMQSSIRTNRPNFGVASPTSSVPSSRNNSVQDASAIKISLKLHESNQKDPGDAATVIDGENVPDSQS